MCNTFIHGSAPLRLFFVSSACRRAADTLSPRFVSASETVMDLAFGRPKRHSGILTSYTRLPLPAPGLESHFPGHSSPWFSRLCCSFKRLISSLFENGIVLVELPSRKQGNRPGCSAEDMLEIAHIQDGHLVSRVPGVPWARLVEHFDPA